MRHTYSLLLLLGVYRDGVGSMHCTPKCQEGYKGHLLYYYDADDYYYYCYYSLVYYIILCHTILSHGIL